MMSIKLKCVCLIMVNMDKMKLVGMDAGGPKEAVSTIYSVAGPGLAQLLTVIPL